MISSLSVQIIFAQLKVSSAGNVGVQSGTSTPLSTLSVGGVGQADARVTIYSKNNGNGLLVNSTPLNGMWRYGIYSGINVQSYYNIGIRGDAYAPTSVSMSVAYGVLGYAGYFAGNVGVTGTINGVTIGNSDIRYKPKEGNPM